jgi:hypothetical protein
VQVLVTPERVERVRIPATYRTVVETVVVRPEQVRLERVPAVYQTVQEQVVVEPGGLQWRPAHMLRGPLPRDPSRLRFGPMGEVYCLVEVEPVVRTVARRVEVSPGRTIESRDPRSSGRWSAASSTSPPASRNAASPPSTAPSASGAWSRPKRTETVTVPAEWRTVERSRPVGPTVQAWREAPCARQVTPDLVRRLQETLNARGYDAGRPTACSAAAPAKPSTSSSETAASTPAP